MATVGTPAVRTQLPVARSPQDAAARALRTAGALPAGSLALGILWSYWPTLEAMVERWWSDPQYSHGFLVPVFAVAVLWSRRTLWHESRWQPSWWGLPVLSVALVMRLISATADIEPLDGISLVPAL